MLLSGLLFMSWCFQHNSLWRKPYSIDFSKILYAANKKKCFFPKINILDMLYSTIFFSAGEKAWNMCSYVILVFEYRLFYIKSVKNEVFCIIGTKTEFILSRKWHLFGFKCIFFLFFGRVNFFDYNLVHYWLLVDAKKAFCDLSIIFV